MGTLGSRWHTAYLFLSSLEHLCNSRRQIGTECDWGQRIQDCLWPDSTVHILQLALPFSCLHAVPSSWKMTPLGLSGKALLILRMSFYKSPSLGSLPNIFFHQARLGDISPLEQLSSCIIIPTPELTYPPTWVSAQSTAAHRLWASVSMSIKWGK